MGRNEKSFRGGSLSARRAWIEIAAIVSVRLVNGGSLSARRAWIEMGVLCLSCVLLLVALRKESVDRNMWWGVRKAVGSLVALRKESVDRNDGRLRAIYNTESRSPQGERG